MFLKHTNAELFIAISHRVVQGEQYVTSSPYVTKACAIYLVLGQSAPPLVSSTITRTYIDLTVITMLITEEIQVINYPFPPEVDIMSSCIVYNVQ